MDARLLQKRYDIVLAEAQFLRGRVRHLELELGALRPAAYKADVKIDLLNRANEKLEIENRQLTQKLDDLSKDLLLQNASLAAKSAALPSFVKANVPDRKKRSRGRRKGHAASHRPMPEQIDFYQTIGLGKDSTGVYCCPRCATQLSDVQNHQRLVEDLAEPKVVVTAYHTVSRRSTRSGSNNTSRS